MGIWLDTWHISGSNGVQAQELIFIKPRARFHLYKPRPPNSQEWVFLWMIVVIIRIWIAHDNILVVCYSTRTVIKRLLLRL